MGITNPEYFGRPPPPTMVGHALCQGTPIFRISTFQSLNLAILVGALLHEAHAPHSYALGAIYTYLR